MVSMKNSLKTEFGDFQTPAELAEAVMKTVRMKINNFRSLLEPTCGTGSFITAALKIFPDLDTLIGVEINSEYAKRAVSDIHDPYRKVRIINRDFFSVEIPSILRELEEPILVAGNPPWVTNSELSAIGSGNLPEKTNFRNISGLDALTGKSNFDISEWMLTQILYWLRDRKAVIAVLCKTAVARNVLKYAWENNIPITNCEIRIIDARKHFNASVDSCFLYIETAKEIASLDCRIYDGFKEGKHRGTWGYRDGKLVSDVDSYDAYKHLQGKEHYIWRSGIKHDCSKIMELVFQDEKFSNGLGEIVDIEESFLFPMLKSSDLSNGSVNTIKRWMIVPQSSVNDDTALIESVAPKTWGYLCSHSGLLNKRGSSVYKKRPQFSIFGIGEYTFSKWKVAISGFYKNPVFRVIGQYEDKPVVLDDTCYFIPCTSREESEFIAGLLNSDISIAFLSTFVFWDSKRPITKEVLGRLDIRKLSVQLKLEDTLMRLSRPLNREAGRPEQQVLFK